MTADSGVAVSEGLATALEGDPVGVLELVGTLCRDLEAHSVLYCHWKSNEAIHLSASGDNDLDLLVRRADGSAFEQILARLGFKRVRMPAWKELPGIAHWYGLDGPTGRLVHVHAHHQLVIGDDMTKNIHLPIEEAYLASSLPRAPFLIPAPEFELALFLIRMVLKHAAWDAILMLQGRLSASERRELADLSASVDPRLRDVMEHHLPFIDATLWDRCRRSLVPGASVRLRISTARRLQRALAGCRRRPATVDTCLKIWRRVRTLFRRKVFRRGPVSKTFQRGGRLVAIVGGDGAGKSTVVEGITSWLGEENIRARAVHMGKPRRSISSHVVRGGLRLAARIARTPLPSGVTLRGSLADPTSGGLTTRSRARLVWEVCTARDRYRAYVRARRSATNGAIVVCDRYPLPEVMSADGAVTSILVDPPGRGRFIGALARIERRYYDRIQPPDLLIVLRVDPDIAVERKHGDERGSFVRPRAEEVWRMDWTRTGARVIDAGLPATEVGALVRAALWSEL